MVIMIYAFWRRGCNSDRPWLRWWANGLYAIADAIVCAIVCWGLLLLQAQLIKAGLLACFSENFLIWECRSVYSYENDSWKAFICPYMGFCVGLQQKLL